MGEEEFDTFLAATEIDAMRRAWEALKILDKPGRRRALAWLADIAETED